jgi:hypothetical protein
MKKLLLILFVFISTLSLAQKLSVSADKNPAIVGEQILIQYSIDTQGSNFISPKFNGLRVLSGPKSSTQSSYSFVNGKSQNSTKTTYSYYLKATKEGFFNISPATIKVDGKTIKSKSYQLNIVNEIGSKFDYVLPIKRYIDERISDWQQQGEFEKTVAFQKRVNESTRKDKVEKYRKETIEHFKKEAITSVNYKDITLKRYNPDLETFLINISGYGSFNLPVSISKAPSFKKKFNASNFSNLDFILEDDKFIVSHFEIDGYSYDISGNSIYKCIGDCQNGYGTYTAKEGTYKGYWKDGSVHGFGVFDGIFYNYEGEYINGKQHGQGKKIYTNGTIEEGLFENGEFVGE